MLPMGSLNGVFSNKWETKSSSSTFEIVVMSAVSIDKRLKLIEIVGTGNTRLNANC